MDQSTEIVEFKWLEAKVVGTDTVVFRLEDGTLVKVKIDVDRAGLALNHKNPDGSPHYNINFSQKVTVVPPEKKFKVPKSQLQPPPPRPPPAGQVT